MKFQLKRQKCSKFVVTFLSNLNLPQSNFFIHKSTVMTFRYVEAHHLEIWWIIKDFSIIKVVFEPKLSPKSLLFLKTKTSFFELWSGGCVMVVRGVIVIVVEGRVWVWSKLSLNISPKHFFKKDVELKINVQRYGTFPKNSKDMELKVMCFRTIYHTITVMYFRTSVTNCFWQTPKPPTAQYSHLQLKFHSARKYLDRWQCPRCFVFGLAPFLLCIFALYFRNSSHFFLSVMFEHVCLQKCRPSRKAVCFGFGPTSCFRTSAQTTTTKTDAR